MTVPASERDPERVCDTESCNAWKMGDFDYCRNHKGVSDDGSSHRNNNHNQKHGLHVSAETFFANADDHHLDTYYAVHEALCSRFERAHGREPMYHDKKELAQVALSMAKLDMADEYAAENADDPEKPLTEQQKHMTEEGPWYKEVVSKIETLKTDIRRENRLLLKDKGIYVSPEKEQAQATREVAERWREALESQ